MSSVSRTFVLNTLLCPIDHYLDPWPGGLELQGTYSHSTFTVSLSHDIQVAVASINSQAMLDWV